jgi:hypothetical protein
MDSVIRAPQAQTRLRRIGFGTNRDCQRDFESRAASGIAACVNVTAEKTGCRTANS